MEGNPEAEQPRRSRVQRIIEAVKGWLTASPRHVGYAAVGLALLLTLPFGGLAAAPQEEQPRTAAGAQVDIAPWRITLERAIHGPELGGPFYGTDGRQHVLVLGQLGTAPGVTGTLDLRELRRSLVVRAEGVELAGPFGQPLDDGQLPALDVVYTLEPTVQTLSAVSPGLTYDIGLHLTAPAGDLPEHLEVGLLTKTYRLSSLEDVQIWTDEVLTTTVEVPTEPSGPVFHNAWEVAP